MTVAESLREKGWASLSARDVIAEWRLAALVELAEGMLDSPEYARRQAEFLEGTTGTHKPFLYGYRPREARGPYNPLHDALGEIGRKRLLWEPIVDVLGPRLEYHASDIMVNLAGGRKFDRMQSQRWHRDPEPGGIVKIFLFLHEVDADNGPFEYVEGSHLDLWDLCPPRIYPKRNIDAELPLERVRTFTCPALTLVYADTRGLHRGAYTGSLPRVNAVWTYLSE